MFSNKTENNISKRTKSLSGIQTISDVYDLESNVIKRNKHHKNKNADSDEVIIMEDLRKLKPFEHSNGRKHDSFPNIEASIDRYLNVNHYHSWIKDTIVDHVHHF